MDTPLLVPLVGVGGTLLGSGVGYFSSWLLEAKRHARERADRWDSGQKEAAGQILAAVLKLEREAWSAASFLDREIRETRLPGYTSLALVPVEGIPGVIDEDALSILSDVLADGFEGLEALEVSVETFAIVASSEVGTEARALVSSLWDVYGCLEMFTTFDDAADSVEQVRAARDRFANEVRKSLGVQGHVVSDHRPR